MPKKDQWGRRSLAWIRGDGSPDASSVIRQISPPSRRGGGSEKQGRGRMLSPSTGQSSLFLLIPLPDRKLTFVRSRGSRNQKRSHGWDNPHLPL